MLSPFPGMNPYLEAELWPDVHHALATKIRQMLAPKISPDYIARLEINLFTDTNLEAEMGILYPDNQINHNIVLQPVEIKIANVEIRDRINNLLVTSIKIISPVNKREPGLSQNRQKRQRLYNSHVHLIEIDLLRRGTRPFNHPRVPDVPYLVTLTRARSGVVNIWPIKLQDCLPIIPVPLRFPDDDIALDLQTALNEIYEEAIYDLSIDYHQPPPPPAMSAADAEWMQNILHELFRGS
ncbi:MAG TPA: DUF4058 family protein [Nostocaceae cyanobacterium]|nr:DUF4058 family protein [Nostocaceae cyanobacterium]